MGEVCDPEERSVGRLGRNFCLLMANAFNVSRRVNPNDQIPNSKQIPMTKFK